IFNIVQKWRERRKFPETLKDLLLCYYGRVKMVAIPDKNTANAASLIIPQYRRLKEYLKDAAEHTRQQRQARELLLSYDELSKYFGYGFSHFAKYPNKPFNFLTVALDEF